MDFSFVIFLCKRCLLGQTKRRGTLLTIFRPPGCSTSAPAPSAYNILHKFPTPLLIKIPSSPRFNNLNIKGTKFKRRETRRPRGKRDKWVSAETHRLVGHTGIPGIWTQELDAGLWTLVSGCWTLDSGRSTQDVGLWTLNARLWTLKL